MQTTRFAVDISWKVLIKDLGINPTEILEKAQMHTDLFHQKDKTISAKEYFRLWNTLLKVSGDPLLPLKVSQSSTFESFHPALFAALCCPNLKLAFTRLSRFKQLVSPVIFDVEQTPYSTSLTIDYLTQKNTVPKTLILGELVFLINLARRGTREHIRPAGVYIDFELSHPEEYERYFGVPIVYGDSNTIVFDESVAKLPFITENEMLWNSFEPDLRKRLSVLTQEESFANRVSNILLELLPSGQSTISAVAGKLMVSKRTLQRRLSEESTSFQTELNKVREKLARHYLTTSELSGSQISFLLGFDEPNSFFRAFQAWTGKTPNQLRIS